MPPQLRIPTRSFTSVSGTLTSNWIAPFLLPFLHPQIPSHTRLQQHPQHKRNASILSGLTSPSGSYSKKIRRGRGPSSGKGKTSGRGHKGQKQHGKVPRGFTGGQTKEEVVKGKRGFKNVFAAELSPLNLDRLQTWIDEGRLDTSKPITLKELNDSRCLHGVKADGVKLLARDGHRLTRPINIVVSRASGAAISAVERAGGQVMTRYYTWQSIRRVLRGQSHPTGPLENFPIHPAISSIPNLIPEALPISPDTITEASADTAPTAANAGEGEGEVTALSPITAAIAASNGTGGGGLQALAKGRYEYALGYRYRLPNPASRKAIEYYRDPAHRGYLAHTVAEGEGPSLFFKKPMPRAEAIQRRREIRGKGAGGTEGKKREVENRLW